jgi:hypothetical protein
MRAGGEPFRKPCRRVRQGVGRDDAAGVEAKRPRLLAQPRLEAGV